MSFFFLFCRHSSKNNLNIKAGGEPQQFQPPTFLTESTTKTVNEGDTVTLDCVANGNPKPQIKWLRNGEDIEINDGNSRFRMIGTGSLHIISIGEADAGNYQCRASNSMDSADIEISLVVHFQNRFYTFYIYFYYPENCLRILTLFVRQSLCGIKIKK